MLERFQSLFGLAAMTAATQLNNLSRSVDPFPEPNGSGASLPLAGLVLDKVQSMARLEVAFGVVPDVERRLRVIANRTPVESLSAESAIERWNGLPLAPHELWVDLGSGNGDSLGRLARRREGRFIGIDKENSEALGLETLAGGRFLDDLPSPVRYLVLSWNRPGSAMVRHPRLEQVPMRPAYSGASHPDLVLAATLGTLGRNVASVVSLLFPYTESSEPSGLGRLFKGPTPRTLDYQLRTAVELLRPGGWGAAVLEAGDAADRKRVLERTLLYLKSSPEIGSIAMTPKAFSVERLGISPYAPRNARGEAVDTEALNEGRLVLFQRRS